MPRLLALMLVPVLAVGLLTAPAASTTSPVDTLYDPTVVRDFAIEMEPLPGWAPPEGSVLPLDWEVWTPEERDAYVASDPDLRALAVAAAWDTVRFDITNTLRLKARFKATVDGTAYDLVVAIRRKSSRALPSEADPHKVGLKVRFGDYVKGQTFLGVSQLSLENGGDVSPLHEGMAWQLHQAASIDGFYGAGHNAARASWVNLSVNGEHLGVYTSVEDRNKQFLRNRGLWTSGSTWFYKQDDLGMPELDEGPDPLSDGTVVHSPTFSRLCFSPFRPTTGEYAATCAVPSDGLLDDELNATINVQQLLTEAAIDAYLVNHDALMKGKNYFYLDRLDRIRAFYPWDLDAVFRAPTGNIYAESVSYNRRGVASYTQTEWQSLLLNHPVLRPQYNQIVLGLLNGPLASARLDILLNSVQPQLQVALANDPYFGYVVTSSPEEHFTALRSWFASREAEVRRQVSANLPAPRKADVVLPTTTGVSLSASSVVPSAEVTVSANIADNAEVVAAEYRVGSGLWIAMNSIGFGQSSAVVTASFVAPSVDGTYPICVRAVDSSANYSTAVCSNLNVVTPKVTTSLVYTGVTNVKASTTFTLAATLTADGAPVSGVTVVFVFNKISYSTTTDAAGKAQTTIKAPAKIGLYPVSGSYAGGIGLTSSAVSATVSVVK